LETFEKIKEAIVTAKEDENGEIYICAYIVPVKELSFSADEMRRYLSQRLPDYMIPSYFVGLAEIPLTPSGKLDRKALPGPKETKEEGDYTAPRDLVERKLAGIWSTVLGMKASIGIDDNFFQLGGHSLKATILMSRIHKELNVKVPLAEIFKTPSIRRLAEFIKGAVEHKFLPIKKAEKKEYYILSSAQKRLYILQQMDVDSTAYNMPAIMTLKGDFQRKKFEEIPGKLIERHESLRTSFIMISIENKPVQRIHEEVEFPIHHWEVGAPGKLVDDRDKEIKAIVENFTRPFDLSKAPLLRIGLIKITREKYLFLFDMHHIITDGISQDILTGEFLALHSGKNLPPPGLQYKDFAEWQNSKEQRKHIKQQEGYWTALFPDEPPVLNLPTDYKRPAMQNFEGDSVNSVLNEEETGNLKKLAAKQGVTLFMTILSIYAILLSKLSGQEDIIVGTPTAGRRHADFGQIIGMFVNTLALRNYPSANKTFKEFLQEVKESTIAAHENQEYPFEDLVEKITVNRDTSRNPVFDVMFNLLDREERFKGTADHNEENIYKKIKEASKFDMNLRVIDRGEKLTFNFEYCTKLFKRDTIERIIGYFKKILSSVLLNPDKKISGIEIIPGARRKKRLLLFNEDLMRECGRGTIQSKISESFQENKNSTAIEYGKNKMLYRELDRRSSCISNWIIHNKIKKGSFIGIYTDDKFEIIPALIGILRARCVFVPLDTMLPEKRINHMLRITNTQIVFTDITNKEKLANICNDTAKKPDTSVINDLFYEKNEGLSLIKEDLHYRFDDKVYVYFTSGTTGEPKGIIGKNESLVQFIQWEIDLLGVNSTFRVSQFTAVGFDAFLRDVFTPLCAGGTICIPGNRDIVMDSNCLIKWIDENRINLIHCVPSLFRLFNTTYITAENFKNLKFVLLSGEHINPPGLKNWFDLFAERIQLVNLYGPTEVTMTKTYYFIKKSDTGRDRIPIGEPIRGCEIILLDKNLAVCDRGMIGEIYIRTPYRTFGYYNDPGLNRERFIPNPFSNDKSDLIYKTGDLGRELADGNIELIGRIDRQVKIRGVRIELDEIENLLLRHQKIKEAIVLAKIHPNGEKYLCAYIAAADEVSFSVPELREYLSKELPDYMIPSFVVTLEKMPLTPSGKIDRKALPEPGPGTQAEVYYAPRNTIEEQLAQVWSEILGIDKINISIDANFFELGGHSLKATTMAAKIHEKINVKVPLAKIFRMSTIRELSKYIITAFKQRYTAIEPAAKKEYYPLSLPQKRFYIIQQLEPENISYNLPMVLQIEGRCPLDKLEQTFRTLIKRHQGLRTSFELKEGEPMQRVNDEVDFAIQYDEAAGEEIDKLTRDLNRPFDLSRAPLMQVALIKVDLAKYILMVEIHHIITDGISIGLLTDEFITLFGGKELPPLKLQYTDFSEWQNRKSQEEMIKQQSEYWFQQFKNGIPGHNLPIDYQRPGVQDSEGDSIYLEISAGETRKLKQLALAEETSLYMVLFSLYYVLLWKLTGQEDIVVGTAVSGRRHMDLMDIIGLFFNTLPIRHRLSGEKTFKEFLTDFNDNTLLAFENQDYPLDKLVEGLVANQILTLQKNRNPLFDTMFSLQNFETRARNIPNVEIPDLKITPYEYDTKISRCDLFFITHQLDSTISIRLQYATALFKKSTVEKIKKHYLEIIEQILENQEIQLKDITISSEFLQVDATVNQEEFYDFGF
jgi:amino acid adenylation domain-containing protein